MVHTVCESGRSTYLPVAGDQIGNVPVWHQEKTGLCLQILPQVKSLKRRIRLCPLFAQSSFPYELRGKDVLFHKDLVRTKVKGYINVSLMQSRPFDALLSKTLSQTQAVNRWFLGNDFQTRCSLSLSECSVSVSVPLPPLPWSRVAEAGVVEVLLEEWLLRPLQALAAIRPMAELYRLKRNIMDSPFRREANP